MAKDRGFKFAPHSSPKSPFPDVSPRTRRVGDRRSITGCAKCALVLPDRASRLTPWRLADIVSNIMQKSFETLYTLEDFVPSLREQFEKRPLNLEKLIRVAVRVKEHGEHEPIVPANVDRRELCVTD